MGKKLVDFANGVCIYLVQPEKLSLKRHHSYIMVLIRMKNSQVEKGEGKRNGVPCLSKFWKFLKKRFLNPLIEFILANL